MSVVQLPIQWPNREQHPTVRVNDPDTCQEPTEVRMSSGRLKALAAHDNGVPFYVALPHTTIDWSLGDGRTIEIEERSADEVLKMSGRLPDGSVVTVDIAAPGSPAARRAASALLEHGMRSAVGRCRASHVLHWPSDCACA